MVQLLATLCSEFLNFVNQNLDLRSHGQSCACFSVDSEDVVVVEATNQGYYPPPNTSLPATDPVQLQGKVYFY